MGANFGARPEQVLLADIPLAPDLERLAGQWRVDLGGPDGGAFRALAGEAAAVARPKAAALLAAVSPLDETRVELDGQVFRSRVLRVNLEGLGRAFPYIVTAGTELAAWAANQPDDRKRFWADALQEEGLRAARNALDRELEKRFGATGLSIMNPGSLADWPLEEQRPLFALLGGAAAAVGVSLTDTLVMRPQKSVSGVRFAAAEDFASCSLCPRENCRNRRAKYDPGKWERYA